LMLVLSEQFGRRLNTKRLEIQTQGLIQPCRGCSQTALSVQMLSVPCKHVAFTTLLTVCCSSRHLEQTSRGNIHEADRHQQLSPD
jgi:hypothetical protein